jgi:hypothetical protein
MPTTDPLKIKEKQKRYYQKHRKRILAYHKEYRQRPEYKERYRKRSRDWALCNPEKIKAKEQRQKEKRWALLKEIKSNPCSDCGGSFPHPAMDFHHPNGDGGKFDFYHRPEAAVRLEAEKCILLCSNCHRVRHFSGTL